MMLMTAAIIVGAAASIAAAIAIVFARRELDKAEQAISLARSAISKARAELEAAREGLGARPDLRATFGARTQMETTKTETLTAAIAALAEKAKAAVMPNEAMQFAQAALNLAHAADLLRHIR
jgi:hypothetical protein